MQITEDGRGVINIWQKRFTAHRAFMPLLLWLLSSCFEIFEVGDVAKPRLVMARPRSICCSTMHPPRFVRNSDRWCG
ncbi:MAG: DUF853 family protein [Burkholderiales bacterium]|nr:DUF853 family protein [Burkholderiales bacterium]